MYLVFFIHFVSLRPYLVVQVYICHKKVTRIDTFLNKLCFRHCARPMHSLMRCDVAARRMFREKKYSAINCSDISLLEDIELLCDSAIV